jgi:hypothetical protein
VLLDFSFFLPSIIHTCNGQREWMTASLPRRMEDV